MSEIDFTKMPNFFLIGAAKAGTTSLHDVLRQHPQIFMSKIKEPNFFNTEKRYKMGVTWYEHTHFRDATGYLGRGESTSNALYWSAVVAPRIKQIYQDQDIKFLAIFRDPVKRAYSYYWMKIMNGMETLSFEDALAHEDERLQKDWKRLQESGKGYFGYYRGGCYAALLQPYLELFPRKNFSFIFLEDLQEKFSATMSNLSDFLGVRSDFNFHPVKSNPASLPRIKGLRRFLSHPSGPLHHIIKLFTHQLPYPLRRQIKHGIIKANLRPQAYEKINKETECQLRIRFLDEIERLEKITERDLSSWKPT